MLRTFYYLCKFRDLFLWGVGGGGGEDTLKLIK